MAEAAPEADEASHSPDELTHLRAAALLPDQLLQGGEVIILLLKPSPWFIVLETLRFLIAVLLVLIIALVLAAKEYVDMSQVDLVLLAIGTMAVRLVWQFLEWLSRVYVLTDRRVIRIMGVLRIAVFESQLQKIQHTVTQFSIRERLFGLGSIGFTTAGTGVIEATWRMIARPLEVHQKVVETLNRYR